MLNRSVQLASVVVLSLVLGACSSKKKVEDASVTDTTVTQAAPQIESTPMNFDAAGSDSGKISGLETVFFDYDKAALNSNSKKTIASNAQWLKANPKVNMQIEGHCDNRGSIEYNLSLGERRAQAVKSYMVSTGIPAARLNVISYGKEKPLVSGDSESAFSKNRRANFVPLAQ